MAEDHFTQGHIDLKLSQANGASGLIATTKSSSQGSATYGIMYALIGMAAVGLVAYGAMQRYRRSAILE